MRIVTPDGQPSELDLKNAIEAQRTTQLATQMLQRCMQVGQAAWQRCVALDQGYIGLPAYPRVFKPPTTNAKRKKAK